MSSAPGPKRMSAPAAAVASHGPTPARRITTRSRTTAVRCSATTQAW